MKRLNRFGGILLFSLSVLFMFVIITEDIVQDECSPFRGGESEALKRLRESIEKQVNSEFHCEALLGFCCSG